MDSVQLDHELQIDSIQLRRAALIYRSVNHPLRQQMLKLIHQQGTITVTELYIRLRLEQSVASQHLAILRKSGIVITERKAKNIFYCVDYSRLDYVHQFTNTLINS
jgi:DNA-binding transcriptional ArsR family regulator